MPNFLGQRDQGLAVFQAGQQRIYIQIDPKPTSPILDYGLTQLGQITFATPEPEQILVPDRKRFNKWKRVGRVYQPDEFQTVDFTTTSNGAGKDDWEDLRKLQIQFTLYNTVGAAADGVNLQADDSHSWTEKGVLPDGIVVSVSPFGESVNSKSENSEALATGTIQHGNGSIARTVEFSDTGGAATDRTFLDALALNQNVYSELFGLNDLLSTTNPSAITYGRTDQPAAYTQTDMTILSTNGVCDSLLMVGNSLVVLRSESGLESHLFSSLDDVRAANDNFTAVTTTYVSAKGPVRGTVLSEGNIILVGLGGYIYRLTNITQAPTIIDAGVLTTEDFADVDNSNGQVVAVAADNIVLLSNEGGISGWAAVTGPSAGNALTAVQVVKRNHWYVGTDNGEVWFGEYTPSTASVIWTQLFMFGTTPSAIDRIHFVEDDIVFGWVLGNGANVYRTTSAGNRFSDKSPELVRLSTVSFSDVAAIASVDQNEVFVVGDAGKIGLGQ